MMDLFHKAKLARDFRVQRISQRNHTLSFSVEVMWLQEEAAVRTGRGGEGLFIPSCLRFPVLLVSFKILLCLYLFLCAFSASSTPHAVLPARLT